MPDDLHQYTPDYALKQLRKQLVIKRDELSIFIKKQRQYLTMKERDHNHLDVSIQAYTDAIEAITREGQDMKKDEKDEDAWI